MTRSFAFVVMIISATFVLPAIAQETSFGHIVTLQTGSLGKPIHLGLGHVEADDTLSVTLDVAFVNSADDNLTLDINGRRQGAAVPCKNTLGSYALDPKDTGVKLNESVLLSAYLAGRRVQLTLSGCVFDKPRIMSVTLSAVNN